MLQIKTTPRLYGITLLGDYQDLNHLYDSISRYLSFYMDQVGEGYPYHEYEYLLSLNYDIRHAYMGDRERQRVENNAWKTGNLYFSVNILYPLVFHYLIAFDHILQDEPGQECFTDLTDVDEPWMKDYTYFDAMADQNQIRLFTSLLWKNVQDLLGKDLTTMIYSYHEEGDYMVPLSLYCDALLHCQLRSFPVLKREEKLQFLELCLYDIIDSDALLSDPSAYPDSYARYEKCRNSLNKKEELPVFPEKEFFYDRLDKAFPAGSPLYEETFDAFLEKTYGHADDDLTDW